MRTLVALPAGERLVIRDVTAADVAGLGRLFASLSEEDRYRRFFSCFHPDERFLRRLVTLGERGGAALVAEVVTADADPPRIVAEAEFARFGGTGDTYQQVIDAGKGTVESSPKPLLRDATFPAIFVIMVFMMWNWWSVYLSGELQSASNRARHLKIMFTSLAWDVVFISMGALLIFKVAGYEFMSSVNGAGGEVNPIPGGPWYHFLAALTANVQVLTIIIVGSFLFWSLSEMVGNTFMPVRTVFAWAFDRLLPAKLADVNERTHSPVPAILTVMGLVTAMLVWSIVATTFQTWLALGVLAGVVCVWIVSVAAFLFPNRRPELYRSSPANLDLFGIPVLKIVAPLSFLVMSFLVYLTLAYPPLIAEVNPWYVPGFMGGVTAFGLFVYYTAKYVRRSQGINIDLVYKELPPE